MPQISQFNELYVTLHRKHTFQRLELFCAFKVLVDLLSIYRSGPPVKVPHLFKKSRSNILRIDYYCLGRGAGDCPSFSFPETIDFAI